MSRREETCWWLCDRSKAAERLTQRRADDRAEGFEVGNDPSRPSHPDGYRNNR